jgi:hypothetical protein
MISIYSFIISLDLPLIEEEARCIQNDQELSQRKQTQGFPSTGIWALAPEISEKRKQNPVS